MLMFAILNTEVKSSANCARARAPSLSDWVRFSHSFSFYASFGPITRAGRLTSACNTWLAQYGKFRAQRTHALAIRIPPTWTRLDPTN
jgi:hypothetical protein